MKDNYSVYEFKGYFKSDRDSIQYRYVCANTEADAMELIQKYSDELVAKGLPVAMFHTVTHTLFSFFILFPLSTLQ